MWTVGWALVPLTLVLSSVKRDLIGSHRVTGKGMMGRKPFAIGKLSLMGGFQVGGGRVLEQEPQDRARGVRRSSRQGRAGLSCYRAGCVVSRATVTGLGMLSSPLPRPPCSSHTSNHCRCAWLAGAHPRRVWWRCWWR